MITICDQDDFLLNKIIIDKLSMENIDLIGNHSVSFEVFHPSCLPAWHMNKSSEFPSCNAFKFEHEKKSQRGKMPM